MSVSEGTNNDLFSVDKESLRKLNEMLSSSRYVDMMESCKNFNHVLLNQRKRCVPFIDQHTGLAQNDCNLWKQSRERMPALNLGQIFTYPARRWIKRKRQYLSAPLFFPPNIPPEEIVMPVAAVETPTFQESIVEEDTKESWFYEMEKEEDFENSDNSDYDFGDRYRRKKASTPKRSRSSRSGGSRRRPATEADPGDDHPKRSRSNRSRHSNSQPVISAPPPPPPVVPTEVESVEAPSRPVPSVSAHSSLVSTFTSTPEKGARKSSMPSLYCDFCLGDVSQNKKTGLAEELISCADCGRSGHPSCLQFTGNMLISVKKYRWQCIECKCCSLCGNSDNDDQLLFCDDCDRGYHMYCLRPPLTEPPEGSWSCSLCMAEFHQPASQ